MPEFPSLEQLRSNDPRLRFRIDAQDGVVRYLRGRLATLLTSDTDAAIAFVRDHQDLFGDVDIDALRELRRSSTPDIGIRITLQQYHGNVPVWNGSVRFHISPRGEITGIHNRLIPGLGALSTDPGLTEDQAVAAAQDRTGSSEDPRHSPELCVFRFDRVPHLVWRIEVPDRRPGPMGVPAQWVLFLDAMDGAVLRIYDNAQTAGAHEGTGLGTYSQDGPLHVYDTDAGFVLRDMTRAGVGGPEISTGDYHDTAPAADPDGHWTDVNTVNRLDDQGPLVDTHRYAAMVVDYFATVHNRNSYDGGGGRLESLVHYGIDLAQAWWDGVRVNVGDGDGALFSFCCSDDWIAHEFTHAYIQHTCALTYYGESGALNEAMCDVFAAFMTGDWLVFEDPWYAGSPPPGEPPALRNLANPTNGGQWDNSSDTWALASSFAGHNPDHYTERYAGLDDNAGVHINSCIIGHLFYLLTLGGTHAHSGITVAPIGQTAAERLLFYCMADSLIGAPETDFHEFRVVLIDACLELYPDDLFKLTQVKNAFNAVGIGPDLYVRDNLADDGTEPYSGHYLWASPDVINRTDPVVNAPALFADPAGGGFWQNVEYGQDNYVYVRVQNRGAIADDAVINVYLSPATTFGVPASWIHIGVLTATNVQPGTMTVAGPLLFPSGLIPAPGHYCMIAVASTPSDPAPDHELVASLPDFLNYVRNSNNIAYRNLDVVDALPDTPEELTLLIQPAPQREQFDLRIRGERLPPGTRLRIRAPANTQGRAVPRGLRLVAQTPALVFEPVAPHLSLIGAGFDLGPVRRDLELGFDELVVDEPLELTVEYRLPAAQTLLRLYSRLPFRPSFELRVEQRWNGHLVGAVGLQLRPPRPT